ncbi:MAG: response regulator [Lachnospiraceae bacterium]|nr:response regulator [Lachnospiraceae bacterium]
MLRFEYDFAISPILFTVVLMIVIYYVGFGEGKGHKLLERYVLSTIPATVTLNIASLLARTPIGEPFPSWIKLLFNSLDFITGCVAAMFFAIYVVYYCLPKEKWVNYSNICHFLMIVYILMVVINAKFGFIMGYDETGSYYHGYAFIPAGYTIPLFYLISSYLIMLKSSKTLNRRQKFTFHISFILFLLGLGIQTISGARYLVAYMFGVTAAYVCYFCLETPDYTSLREANTKLTDMNEKLHETNEELNEMNDRLFVAEQDAIKANQAKSKFLANMSHEIRTPLNVILGMNEFIIDELKDPTKSMETKEIDIKEYAGNIDISGNLLLSIINDILDLSKIESGKLEIINAKYHFAAVIKDIVLMIETKAEAKLLGFELDIEDSLPDELIGDEMRIRQILINLLNNSVKYTDQGVIKLTVTGKRVTEDGIDKVELLIDVYDTGRGIKETDQEKLFGTFTRFDEKKNKNIEGTGLGLSIVKQLVDMMEGSISVKSTYGVGSEFIVKIKQEIASDRTIAEYNDAEREKRNEETVAFIAPEAEILLVDDNNMNLIVAKKFLEPIGANLTDSLSGDNALSLLGYKKYDLVYLDHMMPGTDGIDVIKRVRSDPSNPNYNTHIIAMTANALSGARETYMNYGFDDYISKPVKKQQLLNITRSYLDPSLIMNEGEICLTGNLLKRTEDNNKLFSGYETGSDADSAAADTAAADGDTGRDKQNESEDKDSKIIDKSFAMENCMDDEEMYRSLAEVYVEDEESNIANLNEHYMSYNFKEYAVIAHGIKSTSLYVGAKKLSEMGKELELAAKSENREFIDEKHELFIEAYKKVCDAVRADIS